MCPLLLISTRKEIRAFTLFELLVVIAVIGMLAMLLVPTATTLLKGTQLSQAGQLLGGQLGLARQLAIAKNRTVEVRFYRYGDPEIPGENAGDPTTGKFRALQLFQIRDDGSASALSKVQSVAVSVILDSGATLSPMLQTPKTWATNDAQVPIPRVGTSYDCRAIRFFPDGSTDLTKDGTLAFATLHALTKGDNLASPPANFATIQVDAYNGHIRTFRP